MPSFMCTVKTPIPRRRTMANPEYSKMHEMIRVIVNNLSYYLI